MSKPPPSDRSSRTKSRRIAAIVAIGVVLLAALALWSASQNLERSALQELSEPERRALYERTLHTLQTTCAPQTQPEGLEDYCRDQARFIVQFPECDETCSSLARRHHAEPTR